MGRTVRQKRKARSSRAVVRQHDSKKRPINPTGNVVVAKNWDKTQTLSQNYRRLGLMNRLKLPTGGSEHFIKTVNAARDKTRPATIDNDQFQKKTVSAKGVREVRVERDAKGRIVKVVDAQAEQNPLGDLLNDIEDEWDGIEEDDEGQTKTTTTETVKALEEMAKQPSGPRRQRYQSEGERTWLETLAEHYGVAEPETPLTDEVLGKMARDRRRNPFQRTAADLRRRLEKFRQA